MVQADQPFRLRFELESSSDSGSEHQSGMQFRRNYGAWGPLAAEDFPYPLEKLKLDFTAASPGELADTWNFAQGDA
jgi:hypothetical protein